GRYKKFPIINLPSDSTWPIVIEAVMNLISDEQLDQLRRAKEIHTQLTQLVLNENSVQAIAQSLANLVNDPIVVEDGRFNLITSTLPASQNSDNPKTIQRLIEKRTSEHFQNKLLHSNYYHDVLNGRTNNTLEQP